MSLTSIQIIVEKLVYFHLLTWMDKEIILPFSLEDVLCTVGICSCSFSCLAYLISTILCFIICIQVSLPLCLNWFVFFSVLVMLSLVYLFCFVNTHF